MARPATPITRPDELPLESASPLLEPGDRLSRDAFERRYDQMPELKKAELIEGVVYMPSPVRATKHAEPHNYLGVWLGVYASETPGVRCFDNSSVRLDLDNEPQPDLALMKLPTLGGQARISPDDYIEGAPELIAEIVGSSRAYDLHQKKNAYRRNGVLEYLAWITDENRLLWWKLRDGEYHETPPSAKGLLESSAFPGLWLSPEALLRGDMKGVLATLRHGLESPEHEAFISAPAG
jgi:Uma2 family endonuclease